MPSLNDVLHEIVDVIHGKSTQEGEALHAKVDEAVPVETEDNDAAE